MKLLKQIKLQIKKIIEPNTYSRERYVEYLRGEGIEVGENTVIFSPKNTTIDITRPYLLKIGSNCKITSGVVILTHDFSYSVLRRYFDKIVGECSPTTIGNNCFIGMNAVILGGVTIGSNVIIGAGSIVTQDVPSNVVVAGNPAKIIMSLDAFCERRIKKEKDEAKLCAKLIYKRYGRPPIISEMGAFFHLFLERKQDNLISNGVNINWSGDDSDAIVNSFLCNDDRKWEKFSEFIKEIEKEIEDENKDINYEK